MKRLVVAVAVVVGVVGMAMVAGAATPITNTATSTYQITGYAMSGTSDLDTAIVNVLSLPVIIVVKYARNMRTLVLDPDLVNAISGDSINIIVAWSNTGEADADTVVIRDYIPTGLALGSVQSNTASAGVVINSTTYTAAGMVLILNAVQGTIAGPDNGQIIFSMKVN